MCAHTHTHAHTHAHTQNTQSIYVIVCFDVVGELQEADGTVTEGQSTYVNTK